MRAVRLYPPKTRNLVTTTPRVALLPELHILGMLYAGSIVSAVNGLLATFEPDATFASADVAPMIRLRA